MKLANVESQSRDGVGLDSRRSIRETRPTHSLLGMTAARALA